MFDYEMYYEKLSPIYDQVRLDHKNDFDNTLKIILSQCDENTKDILDIGCGTGRYGQAVKKQGFCVTGVDKSTSQLEQANKIIDTVQANATCLPFADGSFDVCTMIMMIHHLEKSDRQKALNEACRVLRVGGILIIKTCSSEDLQERLTSKFFPEALRNDLLRYPDIDNLREELLPLFDVSITRTKITVTTEKETLIRNFSLRKSSNLGMLTNEQLSNGLQNLKEHYSNEDIVTRDTYNTFLICKKER